MDNRADVYRILTECQQRIEEASGEIFNITAHCWTNNDIKDFDLIVDNRKLRVIVNTTNLEYECLVGIYDNVYEVKRKIIFCSMEDSVKTGLLKWWKYLKTIKHRNNKYDLYEFKCGKCGTVTTKVYRADGLDCDNILHSCQSFLTRKWIRLWISDNKIIWDNIVVGKIEPARMNRRITSLSDIEEISDGLLIES